MYLPITSLACTDFCKIGATRDVLLAHRRSLSPSSRMERGACRWGDGSGLCSALALEAQAGVQKAVCRTLFVTISANKCRGPLPRTVKFHMSGMGWALE